MKIQHYLSRNLLAAAGTLLSLTATAQQPHNCHANEHMDELRYSDPAIALDMHNSAVELEAFTQDFIANQYDPSARTAIYTIPVVVHILHTNGPENISDEQVHDAILRLNNDFNKLNASWPSVHSDFLGIVADCQIEFKLARKTNTGQCTNGITRTYTETTHNDSGNDQVEAVQAEHGNWPGNKYLNIFVVNEASGAAGYTTYPANWSATDMDNGIKILHNYCGGIGTGNTTTATALTHEVGHWLNLMHCWGNSNSPGDTGNCSMDDNVTDTPNSFGWDHCNINGISCSSGVNNVENYMEYSYCSKMFTEGQKARMHAALNSSVGDRDNLWTSANLSATGVSLPDALCSADFSSDKFEICAGESISFSDDSYNYVSGRTWTFNGGTPNNSAVSDPVITYDTPGIYSVTLQVTDGSTTLSSTKTSYVIVHDVGGEPLPYFEGFESLSTFPDNTNFTRIDEDGDQQWQLTGTAFTSGSKSLKLNNYSTDIPGTHDAFSSGTIDLSGVDPSDELFFSFRYAYRQVNSSDDEWLRFYVSKDCGETWVLRKNWHGTNLSEVTAGTSYTPPDESAWYYEEVLNINSDYFVSNFRYKFDFENDGGNNIYIDDINLYPVSMTGITTSESSTGLSVYPNPVVDAMEIRLEIAEQADYSISLINALGEMVAVVYNGELLQGSNQLSYSTAELSPGIYFLRVESNGTVETRKIIKN